jgi:hypothetical protein
MQNRKQSQILKGLPFAAATSRSIWSTHTMTSRVLSALTVALAMSGSLLAQSGVDPNVMRLSTVSAQGGKRPISGSQLPGSRITAAQRQALAAYGPDVQIMFDAQEVPTFMRGPISSRFYPDDPSAEAQAALALSGAAFRRSPNDAFTATWVEEDKSGMPHVHMAQAYKGIPVDGGELTVHLSNNQVTGITGHFVADLDLATGPAPKADQAAAAALEFAATEGRQNPRIVGTNSQVIYMDEANVGHRAVPVQIATDGPDGSDQQMVFVDAGSGAAVGSRTVSPMNAPSGYGQLLSNPGFESGQTGWSGDSSCGLTVCGLPLYKGVATTFGILGPHSGLWYAKLNGHGKVNTESLSQTVTIPSDATSVSLNFWLMITTADCTYQTSYSCPVNDILKVQVIDSTGKTTTLAIYSNLIQPGFSSYVQVPALNLSQFRGQKITIQFLGTENGSAQTSFYIDDTALNYAYSNPF